MSNDEPKRKKAAGNRRQSTRFPAQVESVDLCCRASADVVDESHNGIAVVVDEEFTVSVGQEVSIEYEGAPMDAVVRRVSEPEDGECFIGLEWKTP